MGPDSDLTAERIQAQSFTIAFRGFDQAEVRSYLGRLAAQIRAWQERAENLESAWHSAEERAARPPVLDEDTLMAAVGEETASILRSARAAAAEMRSKAQADAERALSEATAEAERVRSEATAEAERALSHATAEAARLEEEARGLLERETAIARQASDEILAAARADADALVEQSRTEAAELLDKARAEADSVKADAEKQRTLTVEGATATRDRILEDLSRRRRIATVQIEQLRAGRERLIESYAVVRRTLEEATAELGKADAEARAAADEVGRRLQSVAEPQLTEGTSVPEPPVEPAAETSSEPAAEPAVELSPVVAEAPEAELPVADPAGEAPGESSPTAAEPAVSEAAAESSPTAAEPAVSEPPVSETPVAEAPSAEPAATEAPAEGRSHRKRPSRTAKSTPAEASVPDAPAPAPLEPAAPAAEAQTEPAGEGSAVDELFARIRGSGPEMTHDDDESLLQRRESALSDLESGLTRKLKRALQDEQNDVLDRLRSLGSQIDSARLLGSEAEQRDRYSAAARPLLESAAAAGAEFAGEVGPSGGGRAADITALVEEAGTAIGTALRRRLEEIIEARAGDDQSALVESLGAAYREWKTQRVERIGGDLLAAAFAQGVWTAVPEGTQLRWIADDVDGPCADCDDDVLAGEIPKGEPFPTGQHHPPAHAGCRCLLVPLAPARVRVAARR